MYCTFSRVTGSRIVHLAEACVTRLGANKLAKTLFVSNLL